ncbi:MAG TPA: phage holin family protein [Sphingomicrobium sp.]|nr:phage holin family protein [Sphingomicrobium sp.]
MLKPPNETMSGPEDEQPIDELFGRLIDEGSDYARAEFELARAKLMAEIDERIDGYKLPSILIGSAVLLAQAAVAVLAFAAFLALAPLIGTVPAGIIVGVIVLGLAALLVRLALGKLKAPK